MSNEEGGPVKVLGQGEGNQRLILRQSPPVFQLTGSGGERCFVSVRVDM